MKKFLAIVFLLFLSGCFSFSTFKHEPATAVLAANDFMKAMYIEHNYDRAWSVADAELRKHASVADLSRLGQTAEEHCGALKELKAESYQRGQGKMMEVFYVGTGEKTTFYHHIVLIGDVNSGYHVGGVWFQDTPYPANPMRFKFDKEIVVN